MTSKERKQLNRYVDAAKRMKDHAGRFFEDVYLDALSSAAWNPAELTANEKILRADVDDAKRRLAMFREAKPLLKKMWKEHGT